MSFITTDELEEWIKRVERSLPPPQYILIEHAVIKYGRSESTISRKCTRYGVRKMYDGKVKNNPINEADLIEALKLKTPKPKVFNKKMG